MSGRRRLNSLNSPPHVPIGSPRSIAVGKTLTGPRNPDVEPISETLFRKNQVSSLSHPSGFPHFPASQCSHIFPLPKRCRCPYLLAELPHSFLVLISGTFSFTDQRNTQALDPILTRHLVRASDLGSGRAKKGIPSLSESTAKGGMNRKFLDFVAEDICKRVGKTPSRYPILFPTIHRIDKP